MNLADEMLMYRAANDLSQKESAERAGITLQTWTQIERGLQSPSRVTEAKIRLLFRKEK